MLALLLIFKSVHGEMLVFVPYFAYFAWSACHVPLFLEIIAQ